MKRRPFTVGALLLAFTLNACNEPKPVELLASIVITPATTTVGVGATTTLIAIGKDSSGTALSTQPPFTWTSSDSAIATVNNGVVTGVANGSSTITAQSGSVTGTATITVQTTPPTVLASIAVTPITNSVAVGASATLTATGKDSSGTVLTTQPAFTWVSSNPTKATVSNAGVVTGVAVGSSTITVNAGSISGTATVTIVAQSADNPWVVPPVGTFSNISLNTLLDVTPTGWARSDSGGPFSNWSGGVFAADYGTAGGIAIHGSGHLGEGQPIYAGVPVFDLATRLWTIRARPSAPLFEAGFSGTGYNEYFESTNPTTAGHTYAPHTYDGLVYQSTANGGGPDGSLIRNYCAACPVKGSRSVHRFDLNSEFNPPTRVLDQIKLVSTTNNYPATALDEARGGYWVLTGNGNGPLAFIRFSDWSQTNYPGVEFNDYGDHSITYCKDATGREFLIATGRSGPGGTDFSVRVSPIINGVPSPFSVVTPSGTRPKDGRGSVWSARLNSLVFYEADGSYNVHKLTPPQGSLTGSGWAWSVRTMSGIDGAVPSRNYVANGTWGRFLEIPARGVFIWSDGMQQPVQAWHVH
ncbi:MAG: hypothetical protein HC933_05145 [Pleurocapsa sp. SU_196_0]|nr:hypothetical protein [Pleurocapsa sp. SU_196_0]